MSNFHRFLLSEEDFDELMALSDGVHQHATVRESTEVQDLFIIRKGSVEDSSKAKKDLNMAWARIGLKMGFDYDTIAGFDGMVVIARKSETPLKRLRDRWKEHHED